MRESVSPSLFVYVLWYSTIDIDREGVKFRDSSSEIERNIVRMSNLPLCRA